LRGEGERDKTKGMNPPLTSVREFKKKKKWGNKSWKERGEEKRGKGADLKQTGPMGEKRQRRWKA